MVVSLKLNPITGKLDLISSDNFSYNVIALNKTVKIPTNQQMLVHDTCEISGVLVIEGELFVFDLTPPNRVVDTSTSESINIELYELIRQTASGITTSLSGAVIGSSITITNRSGGSNTLNITIQGTASPTLKDKESFSLTYNGIDYDFT